MKNERCVECGFKIRGANHRDGQHHKYVEKHETKRVAPVGQKV